MNECFPKCIQLGHTSFKMTHNHYRSQSGVWELCTPLHASFLIFLYDKQRVVQQTQRQLCLFNRIHLSVIVGLKRLWWSEQQRWIARFLQTYSIPITCRQTPDIYVWSWSHLWLHCVTCVLYKLRMFLSMRQKDSR